MDDGVCLEGISYPTVLCKIMMRRREIQVMENGVFMLEIPSWRLDGEKDVSIQEPGEIEGVFTDKETAGHLPPI